VKRLALLAFLAILVLAACGGDDDPASTPAGMAEVKLLDQLYNGRFAEAYRDLHPSHQAIVSRAHFTRCARRTIPVGQLDSIEILDVFDEETGDVLLGRDPTKGIRIKLTFSDGQTIGPYVDHEVKVGEGWRWVLNQKAIDAYRARRCPM
jgi:hypothetical protein